MNGGLHGKVRFSRIVNGGFLTGGFLTGGCCFTMVDSLLTGGCCFTLVDSE